METSHDAIFETTYSSSSYYIVCLFVIFCCVIMLYVFWGLIGIAVFLPILLLGLTTGGYLIKQQNPWKSYVISENEIVFLSESRTKIIGFGSIIRFNVFNDGLVVEYYESGEKKRGSMFLGKRTEEAYAKLKDAYTEWS